MRRPERFVAINPTLSDVIAFFKKPSIALACDVETFRGQITMIGFARSRNEAIVIPLVDFRKPQRSYWTQPEEIAIWKILRDVLEGPTELIGQNFLYDLQYIIRTLRIRPRAAQTTRCCCRIR